MNNTLSTESRVSSKLIRHDLALVLSLLKAEARSAVNGVSEKVKESISRIEMLIGRLDSSSRNNTDNCERGISK